MFRQRERFERTDVPRESPYRNLIGVIVVVVVLAAAAGIVLAVWNRVSLETSLEDSDLVDAVDAQETTAATADGYEASTDEFEFTLLLTTDETDDSGSTLSSARILSVNATQGTASYVVLPVAMAAVTSDGEHVTLSSLYSSEGYAACVTAVSDATGIAVDHVVVSSGDVVEELAALADAGVSSVSDLVSSAASLLEKIKTDMDVTALVSLASTVTSVGVGNIGSFEVPLVVDTTTDADGNAVETGLGAADSVQLAISLGLLVPIA